MHKESKANLCQDQQGKKNAIGRYQKYKTEPNVSLDKNNSHTQCIKINRSQSFIFNLRVKNSKNDSVIHKKGKSSIKKFMFGHNKTSIEDHKGFTPSQQHKLNDQKQSSYKVLKSGSQKSCQNKLQLIQGRLMKLNEILGFQNKHKKKIDKPSLKKSNENAKEKEQIDHITQEIISQPSLNQQKGEISHTQNIKFHNIKVTFKQLIKAQKSQAFQKSNSKCLEFLQQKKIINSIVQQNAKEQNTQMKRSKEKQFFGQQTQKFKLIKSNSKLKSHIRHSKSSNGYMQKLISSAISIQPSDFKHKRNNSINKQPNTNPPYQSNLINFSKVGLNSASVIQKRKQMLISGWDYLNDFSQRQIIF